MTQSNLSKLMPLYVVLFIGFTGYALMITIFTPMILHPEQANLLAPRHHRTLMLGVLLSLYPLGQLIGCSALGALSDLWGRKKILVFSLAVACLCYVAIAFALYYQQLAALMFVLLLAGLCEGNIAIAQSSIADAITPNKRSQYFGYMNVSISMAYILGPLVGGKMADPNLVPWFNNATPFAAVATLLALTLIWIITCWNDTSQTIKSTGSAHSNTANKTDYFKALTSLNQVFLDRKRRRLFLVNFLIYLALFGFFRSYPMYLVEHFHMSVSQESEFIAWVSIPIILANLGPTALLAKYFSAQTITAVTAITTGIFLIGIIIPNSIHALWLTLFLPSASIALCMPASCNMISQTASGNTQGQIMGNNQSLQVGAETISGLLAGILAGFFINLPLIILAGTSIIAGIILKSTNANYFKQPVDHSS